jgi:AcrR family transcriptional regulator
LRVRTDATRNRILATAASVFLEQGYERASMSEIAARNGGSKATLYGYFRSKQELFLAVAFAEGEKQVGPAFANLESGVEDVRDSLLRVGEKLIAFLITPGAIAAHRMVISEAGRSDIGRHFYTKGRGRGIAMLAKFLEAACAAGKIRKANFAAAAMQLVALIESERMAPALFAIEGAPPSRRQIRQSTERAVDVFLAAYGT